MACNAGILSAVLGGASQPLDLGRKVRLHNAAQRTMLALRDQGCQFPDCDRPAAWCEAHHITPWSKGGKTDVDHAVLLCAEHHQRIHREHWDIRPARTGPPGWEFIPPASIDPDRKPRRQDTYTPIRT